MKKIFYAVLLISVFVFLSGAVSAATTPSCIKSAQDKRAAAIKAATDTLNSATKVALQKRQDSVKAAADALNTATKAALKIEQSAITDAQKNKD